MLINNNELDPYFIIFRPASIFFYKKKIGKEREKTNCESTCREISIIFLSKTKLNMYKNE